MPKVVGVRFQRGCRVYDFEAGHYVLKPGDMVIVETEQGLAMGQVVRGPRPAAEERREEVAPPPGLQVLDQAEGPQDSLPPTEPDPSLPLDGLEPESGYAPEMDAQAAPEPPEEPAGEPEPAEPLDSPQPPDQPEAEARPAKSPPPPLKAVYRPATAEDLSQAAANARLEKEAYTLCQERIRARSLDMNLVRVECLFDRSKVMFYFTADGRLDFRDLVRDLVAKLRTRVELRQIGVRHEAKLLGGLGSCGRELCCASWLKDFEPVSVKMAKEQNLSLNPTKISGLCGRLMCCLTYEYPVYQELKRDLPKLGKRLTLGPELEAKVVRQNVLERKVTLFLSDGREVTCTPEEIPGLGSQPQPPPPTRSGRGAPPAKTPPPPAPTPETEPAPAGQPAPQARNRRRPRHRPKGPAES